MRTQNYDLSTIHGRLKKARIDSGYRFAGLFAKKNKIEATTYRNHENGTRRISLDWLKRYANMTGADMNWLLTGEEKRTKPYNLDENIDMITARRMEKMCPIYGPSHDGTVYITDDNLAEYKPRHPNQQNITDVFALYVTDEKMLPRLRLNEIAYIHPKKRPAAGEDCLVIYPDNSTGLFHLLAENAKSYKLMQYNGEKLTLSKSKVKAIHPIVGIGC